jgi:hypothetical protein
MALSATVVETMPLLAQAQQRLAAAHEAERRLRRDVELPQSSVTWEAIAQAQQETRRAQQWLDTLQRSVAALPTALAEAQQTVLMEERQLASLKETHRKAEAQRVKQAREQVARLEADRRAIEGDTDA